MMMIVVMMMMYIMQLQILHSGDVTDVSTDLPGEPWDTLLVHNTQLHVWASIHVHLAVEDSSQEL